MSTMQAVEIRGYGAPEVLQLGERPVPVAGPGEVLRAANWPTGREPVLVVGHQPTLGELASRLLGAGVDDWPIKKGAVVWLAGREDDDRSHVVLRAAIAPDLV